MHPEVLLLLLLLAFSCRGSSNSLSWNQWTLKTVKPAMNICLCVRTSLNATSGCCVENP